MTFGEKIAKARKEKGLTQEQLAEMIGVAKSTLTGYEKNNREPNLLKLKKIISILEIDPDYLFETNKYKEKIKEQKNVSSDAISLIAAYEAADFDTKNNVRFILKLPLLNEDQNTWEETS